MSDVEKHKELARELVGAMNRADTKWFLDNYADENISKQFMLGNKYSHLSLALF